MQFPKVEELKYLICRDRKILAYWKIISPLAVCIGKPTGTPFLLSTRAAFVTSVDLSR